MVSPGLLGLAGLFRATTAVSNGDLKLKRGTRGASVCLQPEGIFLDMKKKWTEEGDVIYFLKKRKKTRNKNPLKNVSTML